MPFNHSYYLLRYTTNNPVSIELIIIFNLWRSSHSSSAAIVNQTRNRLP